MDALNAVLADVKAALEGGSLGADDKSKVEHKIKELEAKMRALQSAMTSMGEQLEARVKEKKSVVQAGKKFLMADKDLKQLESYDEQLHKGKTGMTDDKSMLSLLLVAAFFKNPPGVTNTISARAVIDVLRRDHGRILARKDNKEVRRI